MSKRNEVVNLSIVKRFCIFCANCTARTVIPQNSQQIEDEKTILFWIYSHFSLNIDWNVENQTLPLCNSCNLSTKQLLAPDKEIKQLQLAVGQEVENFGMLIANSQPGELETTDCFFDSRIVKLRDEIKSAVVPKAQSEMPIVTSQIKSEPLDMEADFDIDLQLEDFDDFPMDEDEEEPEINFARPLPLLKVETENEMLSKKEEEEKFTLQRPKRVMKKKKPITNPDSKCDPYDKEFKTVEVDKLAYPKIKVYNIRSKRQQKVVPTAATFNEEEKESSQSNLDETYGNEGKADSDLVIDEATGESDRQRQREKILTSSQNLPLCPFLVENDKFSCNGVELILMDNDGFKCIVCDFDKTLGGNKNAIRNHVISTHSAITQCPKCDQAYNTYTKAQNHYYH